MNKQPISKQDLSLNGVDTPLQVTEIFDTIQGEGPWSGLPCTFIRLAGCNLRCTWCDTEYTRFDEMYLEEIAKRINHEHVVITGGEPFRQNIRYLINKLAEAGKRVQIETNGTLYVPFIDYGFVTIVCSPKTPTLNRNLLHHIDHFKYVIGEEDLESLDGFPTKGTQGNTQAPYKSDWFFGEPTLMPRDDKDEEKNQRNTETTIKLVQKYGFRLNLQTHKLLNLP